MRISELSTVISARQASHLEDLEIHSLVYDSRRAAGHRDELFIALAGTHHDGHDFISQLYERGVRNFLVSREVSFQQYPSANFLLVQDTLLALQVLAAYHRSAFDIPVVAITGSNGKTIVKEWLAALLEQQWRVVKSPKSYNSQLGVPISVWAMEQSHQVGVFEAGISTIGEMERLEWVIRPTIGIFTNIGQAHSSGFEDLGQKISEKAILFDHCDRMICRIDHRAIQSALAKKQGQLITWGFVPSSATIVIAREGKHYQFTFGEVSMELAIPFQNEFDLENICHAISAALVLGESRENIQLAIDKLKPVPMRLELKRGSNNTYILDDSYNNDLLGLDIALDYLLQQPQKQRKTVILSDILQSGKQPEKLYQEVNALLEKHRIDQLIGIGKEITDHSGLFSMEFKGFVSTQDFLQRAPYFAEETILVKGARDFGLERVVSFLEEKNHGTILEVNFEALTHNLNIYRKALKPNVKLMAMVKAFAYGVGVDEIAHFLQYHQVDYLGVAYLDEAINLRRRGIRLPVMVMNVDWGGFTLLETFGLEPEIYSLEMLRRFLAACDNPPPIHVKIETGMHRLGFEVSDLPELITVLQANPALKVAGIFTHFSSAESSGEDDYTRAQAAIFEEAYQVLSSALAYTPVRHALNSAGILRWPEYQFDMVRLGIGLYGFDSSGSVQNLKPIGTLKTRISQIKQVKPGDTIGYSRKGRAEKHGQIATLAIGYADGYSRAFGNGEAYVLVNGKRAPTIGNICMDMAMIDISGIDAREGDEVIIFGEDPNIRQLANWAKTIPYEILTNVSQRVKRVFVSE